jgi:hypothetical protein
VGEERTAKKYKTKEKDEDLITRRDRGRKLKKNKWKMRWKMGKVRVNP